MEAIINYPDLGPVMPEIIMVCAGVALLVLDLFIKKKENIAYLSMLFTAMALYAVSATSGETFGGMYISDGYSSFFKSIFLISLLLCAMISVKYISVEKVNRGEYYILMMFSTLGMMVMASAGDLIVLYLGLELMALCTYVLSGFKTRDLKSNEAALKYFLLGAFASGFLLYGISLTYGITGTTNIAAIAEIISTGGLTGNPVLMLSMIFFAVSFGFKIAAAPFHMWAPDVYEGAPTSITAFMSVGPKAAGFAVMGKVFLIAFASAKLNWTQILIPIAILTMATGNLMALVQTNIKRMLAYSSIAHAGYILLGVIAGGAEGVASMMNYLFIYMFMNLGAFAIVVLLRREGFEGDQISDFTGLSKAHPLAAAIMLVFMFSLTGIPPTAGFIGKYYLFSSVIEAGYVWLVGVALFFSVISAYYYLRVVMYMYMKEPEQEVPLSMATPIKLAITVAIAAVIIIGVLPASVIEMARLAVESF